VKLKAVLQEAIWYWGCSGLSLWFL